MSCAENRGQARRMGRGDLEVRYPAVCTRVGKCRSIARARGDAARLLHDDVLANMATKQDLKELEQSLTIRFGSMLAMAVGIIVAAQKLL